MLRTRPWCLEGSSLGAGAGVHLLVDQHGELLRRRHYWVQRKTVKQAVLTYKANEQQWSACTRSIELLFGLFLITVTLTFICGNRQHLCDKRCPHGKAASLFFQAPIMKDDDFLKLFKQNHIQRITKRISQLVASVTAFIQVSYALSHSAFPCRLYYWTQTMRLRWRTITIVL